MHSELEQRIWRGAIWHFVIFWTLQTNSVPPLWHKELLVQRTASTSDSMSYWTVPAQIKPCEELNGKDEKLDNVTQSIKKHTPFRHCHIYHPRVMSWVMSKTKDLQRARSCVDSNSSTSDISVDVRLYRYCVLCLSLVRSDQTPMARKIGSERIRHQQK